MGGVPARRGCRGGGRPERPTPTEARGCRRFLRRLGRSPRRPGLGHEAADRGVADSAPATRGRFGQHPRVRGSNSCGRSPRSPLAGAGSRVRRACGRPWRANGRRCHSPGKRRGPPTVPTVPPAAPKTRDPPDLPPNPNPPLVLSPLKAATASCGSRPSRGPGRSSSGGRLQHVRGDPADLQRPARLADALLEVDQDGQRGARGSGGPGSRFSTTRSRPRPAPGRRAGRVRRRPCNRGIWELNAVTAVTSPSASTRKFDGVTPPVHRRGLSRKGVRRRRPSHLPDRTATIKGRSPPARVFPWVGRLTRGGGRRSGSAARP